MKMINRYCLLSLAVVSSVFVNAQQPTSPQERKIIEKALDNFEMYKSCITVADDETRSYFLDLFRDKSVPVYNDLLGITGKSDINITDYLAEQKSNLVSPIIKISNVNRDRIWEEDGKWKVQLSFDKSLSYQNQCGINFNTQDFYGSMFRETMILSYDEANQTCLIESITGKIDSNKSLPDDYCILLSKDEKDARVIYKHTDGTREQVKFNSFGQMMLTSGYDKKQFSYPDNDVIVKSQYKPECHVMSLSYKSRKWRIKAHYDMGLGNALSVANESFYSSVSSKSSAFGLDAGYVFPSRKKIKIGVFMGLGITSSSIDLSCQPGTYSFTTDQDIDGDTYERIYENVSFSQKTKFSEFSIPIYADFDWRFSRLVSFYVDLGLKLNINISTSVDEFLGKAENVHGIYHDYDDLLLDYRWGYNGFTQELNLTQASLCGGEHMTIKKFAPDLLLGAGFRLNIPRTPLALDLGLGYQMGLGDLISVPENADAGSYSSKLLYNQSAAENSTEHVHDLIESAGSVSRKVLRFNIGLIFKF